jgi:hypothetical protein
MAAVVGLRSLGLFVEGGNDAALFYLYPQKEAFLPMGE